MEDVGPRPRRAAWALAIGWAGLIWALSSISRPWLPTAGSLPVDKIAHAIVFGILGALVLRALASGRPSLRVALAAIALAAAYGGIDELHQRFVPGRQSSIADVVADAVGASLAVGIAAMLRRR